MTRPWPGAISSTRSSWAGVPCRRSSPAGCPFNRPANRPFHDALEGLIHSLDALGRRGDSAALRTLKERLSGAGPTSKDAGSGRPDPGV